MYLVRLCEFISTWQVDCRRICVSVNDWPHSRFPAGYRCLFRWRCLQNSPSPNHKIWHEITWPLYKNCPRTVPWQREPNSLDTDCIVLAWLFELLLCMFICIVRTVKRACIYPKLPLSWAGGKLYCTVICCFYASNLCREKHTLILLARTIAFETIPSSVSLWRAR